MVPRPGPVTQRFFVHYSYEYAGRRRQSVLEVHAATQELATSCARAWAVQQRLYDFEAEGTVAA